MANWLLTPKKRTTPRLIRLTLRPETVNVNAMKKPIKLFIAVALKGDSCKKSGPLKPEAAPPVPVLRKGERAALTRAK